ncbi:MAG: purine-binding chemotaxis protein CheW [Gammaproteobacteria bacterium]|nr:purine-binding chemotaxis protein CheW [Gammaproteobacteria bacterium]
MRSQLAALGHAIEGLDRDAADEQAELSARAKALARIPETREAEEWLELLVFELGTECYALETAHISEVLPLRQLTPLPGTPSHVLGIVNSRGRLLAVIDMRHWFELPIQGLSDRNNLVVLQGGGMEFAVLADRVQGVRLAARSRLTPELANLSGIRAAYLLGLSEEGWIVLDGGKLLGDPRIAVDQGG